MEKYTRIWTAVDRNRNEIIAFEIGDGSWTTGSKIWQQIKEKVNKIKWVCTDGNFSYGTILPTNPMCYSGDEIVKHEINKAETCLVESFNSLLRHYIPCLARKTKAFAKSEAGLHRAMKFFMFRKIICKQI
jgi:IS1 family transposase